MSNTLLLKYFIGFFLVGSIQGAITASLTINSHSFDLVKASFLSSAFAVGVVVAMATAKAAFQIPHLQKFSIGAMILSVLGYCFFSQQFIILLISNVLIGLCFGIFDTYIQTKIAIDSYKRSLKFSNLSSIGFGVGAFTVPLLLSRAQHPSLSILGLEIIVAALLALVAFWQETDIQLEARSTNTTNQKAAKFVGLIFFIYAIMELLITSWTYERVSKVIDMPTASRIIALFWVFALVGRFIFPYLTKNTHIFIFFLFGIVLLLSIYGLSLVMPQAYLALPLAGFFIGPLFPTLISFVGKNYSGVAGQLIPLGLLTSNLAPLLGNPVLGWSIQLFPNGLHLFILLFCIVFLVQFKKLVFHKENSAAG